MAENETITVSVVDAVSAIVLAIMGAAFGGTPDVKAVEAGFASIRSHWEALTNTERRALTEAEKANVKKATEAAAKAKTGFTVWLEKNKDSAGAKAFHAWQAAEDARRKASAVNEPDRKVIANVKEQHDSTLRYLQQAKKESGIFDHILTIETRGRKDGTPQTPTAKPDSPVSE